MSRSTRLLCTIGVWCATSAGLAAQVPESCGACRARVVLERSVGGAELPLADGSRLARDGSGRLYVTHAPEAGVIAMLGADGRVERSIGRLGSGPGEFSRSTFNAHAIAGDSLVVLDGTRVSVLAPQLRAVVASRSIETHAYYWFAISSDSLVVQVPLGDRGLLHLFTAADRNARPVGAPRTSPAPSDPYDGVRVIGPGRSRSLWTSPVNRFSPVRLSLAGDTLARLDPGEHWFRPWAGYDRERPLRRPPLPHVHQLHEDPDGILWVMMLVPDKDWAAVGDGIREIPTSEIDWSKIWDTVIEAWDVQRGQLLGRSRVDGQGLSFIDDRSLYVRRTDADGDRIFDVFRLSVAARP